MSIGDAMKGIIRSWEMVLVLGIAMVLTGCISEKEEGIPPQTIASTITEFKEIREVSRLRFSEDYQNITVYDMGGITTIPEIAGILRYYLYVYYNHLEESSYAEDIGAVRRVTLLRKPIFIFSINRNDYRTVLSSSSKPVIRDDIPLKFDVSIFSTERVTKRTENCWIILDDRFIDIRGLPISTLEMYIQGEIKRCMDSRVRLNEIPEDHD